MDIEVDDGEGAWCENCLAMSDSALASLDLAPEGNIIVLDEHSGRWMCQPCKQWGDEHLYPASSA